MEFVYRRIYRGPIKAVVLDWAGTTVDYGCFAPAGVFIEVFKQKGIEITIDEARLPMGLYKRDHIRVISEMPRIARLWEDQYKEKCTEADIDDMFENFIPLQLEVIANYTDLIPRLPEIINEFKSRKIKIGSSTGYTQVMMDILCPESQQRGFLPDSVVCVSDVPAGRPYPWMCYKNAMNLNVYPMESMVKIGDTIPDIAEGLNAGMWTIGIAVSGNEFGMTEADVRTLDPIVFETKRSKIYDRLTQAGAHYVIDGIWDVIPVLDKINQRLANGERP